MKHFQFFIRLAFVLAFVSNVAGFGSAPVSAQTDACTVAQIYALKQQRQAEVKSVNDLAQNIGRLKKQLAARDSNDPKVINGNYEYILGLVRILGQGSSSPEGQAIRRTLEDELDFWREKKREIDAPGTKGLIDNNAGARVKARLTSDLARDEQARQQAASRIKELDNQIARCQGGDSETSCTTSIVGTWKWWNGLTVTFTPGGGASYRGGASGSGSWQHTGGNSYHAHWNSGNTDDYFTLSRDGTKIEGQFDGKPGTSTRRC